jgi:hypothetical protein
VFYCIKIGLCHKVEHELGVGADAQLDLGTQALECLAGLSMIRQAEFSSYMAGEMVLAEVQASSM